MFPRNEGPVDRTIRVVAGFVLIAVGLFVLGGVEASVAGVVVAAFGGWLVATGAIGVCPLYVPFGIDTLGTTHGPFGIRLRATHGQAAPSSESDVPVVRRSRQDALR
jgi:Protein of unknown function (DUF2892)